ncbi:MAG: DUF4254 domain-containing protein [Flavobacteriales bacterium]|jgi:hypothetical protein|nr:DUF4254 domain-containing protein [Flavobacteriales bacterium]
MNSKQCIQIFNQSIQDYHIHDNVATPITNPFEENTIEALLYLKNWVDTVQWHYEDIIRDPEIDPIAGMELKRKIDKSNQHRTDLVEQIDDFYIEQFKTIEVKESATLNTESPAWVVDRLSILCLKIYHMQEQTERADVSDLHRQQCEHKLAVLKEQEIDLSNSFDQLLEDFAKGDKKIKVYRQMKMYNDNDLNPVLYKNK